MKIKNLFLLTLFISFNLQAKDQEVHLDEDPLNGFISGDYHLIGKELDSKNSYYGEIKIYFEEDQLLFEKSINENNIKGTAHIEGALADEVKVLRLRYTLNDKKMEQTCLIDSDLDNYARLSCYVYEKGQATDSPGLESMFIKQ